MLERLIYLDHAATTPLDSQVLGAMMPFLTAQFGNPSSIHRAGRTSLDALDRARDVIAAVLGASPKELIFTGGGTEADNLAIKGTALAQRAAGRGAHIITTAVEHHAVLHACEYLEQDGFEITLLPVDGQGAIQIDDLRAALRCDTVLVSVMYANNEVGTIQPVAEAGAICRERGVPFHVDAVQAAGALPLNVRDLNVDLMTIAAHKFYGPKGVGMLYVRRGTPLLPQINGGAQERRRRAGTEKVAAIVGMAEALQLAESQRGVYVEHCGHLRDRLQQAILARVPFTHVNGDQARRLPNILNVSFDYIEGESVLLLLDQHGIAASSGSACTSGSLEASHVLLAMGLDHERALGSVRFSLGRGTTEDEIDSVIEVLPGLIEQLRSVSPAYADAVRQAA
jgi:cysteine desulfurase